MNDKLQTTMKTRCPIFFLSFIFIILIWSCSKEDSDTFDPDTGSSKVKLQKIVFTNTKDSAFYEFKYDNNGRISNMFITNTETREVQSWGFSRNSAGQITLMTYNEDEHGHFEKYDIGNDGKYISSVDSDGSKKKYIYTGDRVTRIEHPGSQSSHNLTWDSRGNLVKFENSDTQSPYKWEATYDNKINPVESLDFPGAIEEFPRLGWHNNVLTHKDVEGYSKGSSTFSYTYNNSGKPITGSVNWVDSDGDAGSLYIIYVYK